MKKNISLVFISVLFVFCLFELYLRFNNYQPWLRSEPGQFEGVEITAWTWPDPHPEFGWTFNKHHPVRHRDKYNNIDIIYFGNKEGFRDSKWKSASDISPDTNNIIVLGDSMAFGSGVEEEERIGNQLEKLLNYKYKVYNIAVPGWGLDQMMLAFKKYAPIVKPEIAIIAFINDDLHRSLEAFRRGGEYQNKPSFRLKNGSLELRKVDDEWRFYKYLKKNILSIYSINIFYGSFYKKYLMGALNKKIAEEIINTAKAYDIKTIFVRIPEKRSFCPTDDGLCRFRKYLDNRIIGLNSFFQEKDQIFIDVIKSRAIKAEDDYKNLYFPYDGHINKIGHRLIAEIIAKQIKGS